MKLESCNESVMTWNRLYLHVGCWPVLFLSWNRSLSPERNGNRSLQVSGSVKVTSAWAVERCFSINIQVCYACLVNNVTHQVGHRGSGNEEAHGIFTSLFGVSVSLKIHVLFELSDKVHSMTQHRRCFFSSLYGLQGFGFVFAVTCTVNRLMSIWLWHIPELQWTRVHKMFASLFSVDVQWLYKISCTILPTVQHTISFPASVHYRVDWWEDCTVCGNQ